MADFATAIGFVLGNEGCYSHHPHDLGGETKYGISQKAYPNEDIANLTLERAKELYRRDYWRFDGLDNQRLAAKLLDMAVNLGLGQSVKLLQETLRDCGFDVAVDGICGTKTCAVVNLCNPESLLMRLREVQAYYYHEIVVRHPEQACFLAGWLRRATL